MTARDWFLIIFTLLVGMFSGFYLYVTSFAPLYEEQNPFESLRSDDTEIDIIGVMYVYNTDTSEELPSFRIRDNGTYRYDSGGNDGGEIFEGTLPRNLNRSLRGSITVSDMETLSRQVSSVCRSGDVAYEYNIELGTALYELDTCLSNFSHASELGELFLDIWAYMEENVS